MKQYPEIPRSTGTSFMELPGAYIFDKLDGRHQEQRQLLHFSVLQSS